MPIDDHFADWRAERNTALLNLDMAYARRILPHGDDETRLAGLHKARYECVDMPDEARVESRQWLEKHGYARLGGMSWSTDGKLPEGAK
jgi:hypothetical protein